MQTLRTSGRDWAPFAPARLTAFMLSAAFGFLACSARIDVEADGSDFDQVVGMATDDTLNIRAEPNARASVA